MSGALSELLIMAIHQIISFKGVKDTIGSLVAIDVSQGVDHFAVIMMVMTIILMTVFHGQTVEPIIFIMDTKSITVDQWIGLVALRMRGKQGDSEVAWLEDIEDLTEENLKRGSSLTLADSRLDQRRSIGGNLRWVRYLTGDIGLEGRIRALRFRGDVDGKISAFPQAIGRVATGFK